MIEAVRSCLNIPDLSIETREDWGSKTPEYRLAIRRALLNLYPETHSLLDLEQLPNVPGQQISISHTQTLGGFAISSGSLRIGFDIELTSRIEESQLTRVSRYQDESKLAPSPNFLWTAKEAGFKAAAHRHGLRVLADVVIKNWSELRPYVWQFENDIVKGVTLVSNEYTLAVAQEKP